MIELKFYHRQGCHLCDEMLQQLDQLKSTRDFRVLQVDIDRCAETKRQYGIRIPVLEGPGGECLSEHFLDRAKLLNYLRGA